LSLWIEPHRQSTRTTRQIVNSEQRSGDLLFSAGSDGTPANPGHVVMYLGGAQVIQAPQAGQDVQAGPADLASVVVATRSAGHEDAS